MFNLFEKQDKKAHCNTYSDFCMIEYKNWSLKNLKINNGKAT